MRRYESFSPTIPDYTDRNVVEENQNPKEPTKKENIGKNENKTTKKAPQSKKKIVNDKESDSILKKMKDIITSRTTRWILGLLFSFFAVYLAIAFISYFSNCISDQSEINNTAIGKSGEIANATGEGGARLSEFLINEFFGIGSFIIIIWLFLIGLKLLSGKPRFKTVNLTIKCLIALITLSLIVGLLTIGMESAVNWGGYHGRFVNEFIIHFLGWSGAVLLCIFMVCCFVLICMRDVLKWGLEQKKKFEEKRRIKAELRQAELEKEMSIEEMRRFEDSPEDEKPEIAYSNDNIDNEEASAMKFDGNNIIYDDVSDIDDAEFATYNLEDSEDIVENDPHSTEDDKNIDLEEDSCLERIDNNEDRNDYDNTDHGEEYNLDKEETNCNNYECLKNEYSSEEKIAENGESTSPPLEMIVNVNSISQVKNNSFNVNGEGPEQFPYKFPPFELLREGETKISVDTEEQIENKEKIRRTLLDFDIPITNIEATVGPTVTLYEIVPDKGVRVSKIRALVDDIALSLSAEGVRIIAPIPGKGTVGIEVANKDPQTVSMRTVLKSNAYQQSKYKLPIAVGSTISNEVFITDLAKMPHLLVAGATGQGKSVGLNAIIASLLYSKRPDELKFVMIDPKMVEFSLYSKIEAHYLAKIPDAEDSIITDMDKVVATLSSLCIEMDNRYQLLKEASTRNIIEYNEKIKEKKLNPNDGHRYLPYIVVIVDEFSDLIMTAGKEVEIPIARLAQKARAVGMHVIIATQRPSTNVITGIIKANFPARIAFKVSSGVDSKTILDTTGAQQLIGRGDMLVSNSAPMVRVQCAFIDTPEVEKICEHISRQPYAQGAYLLPEPNVKSDIDGDSSNGGLTSERDPLFEEVARLVVTTNSASTSSLQRRYSIGYNRAGKIMDQLEAAGIVGPAQGGKPRSVLMDPVTLDLLLDNG